MSDELTAQIQKRINAKIAHLKKLGMYDKYMDEYVYRQALAEEMMRDIMLEQRELRNSG